MTSGETRPANRSLIASLADALQADTHWSNCCKRPSKTEPSSVLREGGVIADGFDAELDELRGIQTNCGDFLLALETRERARTGIDKLKVEYNRVHGFYIEVTHRAMPTRCRTTTAAARR